MPGKLGASPSEPAGYFAVHIAMHIFCRVTCHAIYLVDFVQIFSIHLAT